MRGTACVSTEEAVEYTRYILLAYSNASVGNGKLQAVVLFFKHDIDTSAVHLMQFFQQGIDIYLCLQGMACVFFDSRYFQHDVGSRQHFIAVFRH